MGSVKVHNRPGRPTMLERVAISPSCRTGALAGVGSPTVWQAKQESLNRFVAVKVDQRPLDVETEQRRFLERPALRAGFPGIRAS